MKNPLSPEIRWRPHRYSSPAGVFHSCLRRLSERYPSYCWNIEIVPFPKITTITITVTGAQPGEAEILYRLVESTIPHEMGLGELLMMTNLDDGRISFTQHFVLD